MICTRCIRVLKMDLSQIGVNVVSASIGSAIIEIPDNFNLDIITECLQKSGFDLILDKEKQLVEQIKIAVIELIHYMNNIDSIIRKSDYLVEKLGISYQNLSKTFSKHENITLEKYIILNKIEKIKELIESDEYTLSEIAFMMDYSSVQYLSNQFKQITGQSVTEYKVSPTQKRIPLDLLK